MLFYAGRISLLPQDSNLFYIRGKEKDFSLVTNLLAKDFEFVCTRKVHIINEPIIDSSTNQLTGGLLGKISSRQVPDREGKHFVKKKILLYPNILYIVDIDEQVILIQKKASVFDNPSKVFDYVTEYLNHHLFDLGLEVIISPITDDLYFWDSLEYSHIYSVSFELSAPNFFGDAKKHLKDILTKTSQDTNSNQVIQQLRNKAGNLKIPHEKPYTDMIDWIKDGGGSWRITAGSGGYRRVYIKSSDNMRQFHTNKEIILENYTAKEIKEILESIERNKYKVRKDN